MSEDRQSGSVIHLIGAVGALVRLVHALGEMRKGGSSELDHEFSDQLATAVSEARSALAEFPDG